jgi:hypothetical protein
VIIEGFDDRAGTFMKQALEAGGAFATELLKRPLHLDKIISFSGESLSSERKHAFTTGGLPKERSLAEELADYVVREASSLGSNLIIVEDRECEPTSKFLQGLPFVHYGGQVLLALASERLLKHDVLRLIRSGTSYPFIMALSHGEHLELQKSIDLERLQLWARKTVLLAIGAYDEESYLVCKVSGSLAS